MWSLAENLSDSSTLIIIKGGHQKKYYCRINLRSRDCFLCVIDDSEKILIKKKAAK